MEANKWRSWFAAALLLLHRSFCWVHRFRKHTSTIRGAVIVLGESYEQNIKFKWRANSTQIRYINIYNKNLCCLLTLSSDTLLTLLLRASIKCRCGIINNLFIDFMLKNHFIYQNFRLKITLDLLKIKKKTFISIIWI